MAVIHEPNKRQRLEEFLLELVNHERDLVQAQLELALKQRKNLEWQIAIKEILEMMEITIQHD